MRCLKYRAQVSPGFASFSQQKDRSSHVSSLPWYPDGWSLACAEHPVPDDTKKVDFPAYHLWLLWYFMIVTVLAQNIYIYMMIIHVTSCILSYSFVCVSAHVYDISIWPKRGRHVGGQTSFICWRLRAKTSLPITNKPCTSNYHFSATKTQIPNHPSTIMYQPYNVRPPSDVCWFINPSN